MDPAAPNGPVRSGLGPWARWRARHLHDYNPAAAAQWIRLVLAGTAALALAGFELSALGAAELWQVAGLSLLVLLAGAFPIEFPRLKLSVAGGDLLVFLQLALFGVAAATIAAAIEGAVAALLTSKRLSSRLATPANAAAGMLLAGSAFESLQRLAVGHGLAPAAAHLASLAIAAAVYLVAGTVPLMRVLALKQGRDLGLAEWRRHISWVGAMYFLAALLAAALSLQAQQHGRSVVAVAVLVLGLALAWLRAHFRQQALEQQAQEARVQAAELEAELHLKRFHRAFTQASIGIAIVDAGGQLRQANPALGRLLGRAESQLVGRQIAELLHAGDAALLQRHVDGVLASREEAFSIELRCHGPAQREIWVALHCALFEEPAPGGSAAAGVIFQMHDITSRRRAEGALHHIAFHDHLTDLANRNCFQERLRVAVERSASDRRCRFALMLLDLDRFKLVNDSLGHPVGDELLKEVARRLESQVRPPDLVARLGGDEFAILLERPIDTGEARRLGERLLRALEQPMAINGTELRAAASIGVTFSDMGHRQPDEILRDADLAMYRAKAEGRGRLAFFDIALREALGQKLQLEADLRRAIGEGQLRLAYQPLYTLQPYRLNGFEALARWAHPQRGNISPAVFIALAEETGCIEQLTAWAIAEAARQMAQWRAEHADCAALVMHVNVSGLDLARPRFVPHVREVLQRHRLPPGCLLLEITESTLMEQREKALGALHELVAMGVKLGIDDFGTGYSSLAYLSTLPFDCLKIDRSFVSGMCSGASKLEIVRTVLTLGRSLGKQVVAEGIETQAQLAQLRELGATIGQGYLLGRPLSPEQAQAVLSAPLLQPA